MNLNQPNKFDLNYYLLDIKVLLIHPKTLNKDQIRLLNKLEQSIIKVILMILLKEI